MTLICWSSLAVLLGEVFCVLHELLPVFHVLFCQITSERMVRFGFVDQGHQRLNDLEAM